MSDKTFEIRVCESCGLRYPLMTGHAFGTRCPICTGTTRAAVKLVSEFKVEGWRVFALEESAGASSISQFTDSQTPSPSVLIVGNEVTGVDPGLLSQCERIFFIPMRGEKKSFNAAVAFGIAAHAMSAP